MDVNEKLNIPELLKDLENYRPRRKGWTWRKALPRDTQLGPFRYKQISQSLKNSLPLPAATAPVHVPMTIINSRTPNIT